MKFCLWALIALSMIASPKSSHAFETDDGYGYQDLQTLEKKSKIKIDLGDATRVQKFEAALDTLGIPQERTPDFSNFVHAGEVNQKELETNLSFIDPDQGLARYLSIVKGNLQLFRDFFKSMISLDYLEYQQTLSTENTSNDSSDLMNRLKSIAAQAQSGNALPLQGLKILIDPGHMGGEDWDHDTGKYVEVNGRKVSEGDLTLWTSLLTAQKLEKLGATVLLTRDKQGAVSTENPKTFDATPFINQYFYNSMDDWMAPYLTKSIDQVRSTIKNASEVQKAYSSIQRMQFFITGADLEARSKMIDEFNPDITLDIHFDASKNDELQNTAQSLEAFVPGGFRITETGSRKVKALALKHALEVRRWNQSVELADTVTQSMSTALQIPRHKTPEAFTAIRVRDGVYARNLYIARRALSGLVIYLECLHYDHVSEHKNLSILDQTGNYRNTAFRYPNRLNTISNSIEDGLVQYFQNLKI